MTLNQLKYFCETCRCHSITAAANQLFVTQPAISLAIRELEAEFGITLFTRFNNRLSLTESSCFPAFRKFCLCFEMIPGVQYLSGNSESLKLNKGYQMTAVRSI